MRAALTVCVAAACAVLGALQLASMALYGDLARAPAVPALLPPALGIALDRPLRSARFPSAVRAAYAAALLHRGYVAGAAAIVAVLPAGTAADDLRGQLAERSGDTAAALGWYAGARDVERAQRLIDADAAAGRVTQAERLEGELVAGLGGDADTGVRARALWRLGQLTEQEALTANPDSGALAKRALAFYQQALELAPNEETYLLAAGEQALVVGDKAAAAGYYRRALEAVPNSADARAGLARSRT